MAIITIQELEEAQRDSTTIEAFTNGPPATVTPRYGDPFPNIPKLVEDFYTTVVTNTGLEYEHLTYVPGTPLTVDRPTQAIDYNDSVYRVKFPQTFPLVLTGVWATDGPKLVDVGDQSLRQSMASPPGAGMVGFDAAETYPTDTVGAELETLHSEDVRIEALVDRAAVEQRNSLNLHSTYNGYESAGSISGARAAVVMGDSIAFGAGAGVTPNTENDIRNNAWVRLLQKAMNIENGGNNYGFVSGYRDDVTGFEIHSPVYTGTWTAQANADAGHMPNGWGMLSSTAASKATINLNSQYRKLRIWHDGTKTGSYKVTLNNTINLGTFTTDGTGNGWDHTAPLDLADWLIGGIKIEIEVLSGSVMICGYEYSNDTANFSLHNFSRDGRATRYMTQGLIQKACNSANVLIWAMGANDRDFVGSAQTEVIQRHDWLIQYANQYGVRLVIVDSLFYNDSSHWMRAEFRRIAAAVNGAVLVPMPNLFTPDGSSLTIPELIDRNICYDGVHLNPPGHRMVFETVARYMGMSVTSKALVYRHNTLWKALNLINGAQNATTDISEISAYRVINGNTVQVRLNLAAKPVSGTVIGSVWAPFQLPPTLFLTTPDSAGKTALIQFNAAGQMTIFDNAASTTGAPTTVKALLNIPCGADTTPWYY